MCQQWETLNKPVSSVGQLTNSSMSFMSVGLLQNHYSHRWMNGRIHSQSETTKGHVQIIQVLPSMVTPSPLLAEAAAAIAAVTTSKPLAPTGSASRIITRSQAVTRTADHTASQQTI